MGKNYDAYVKAVNAENATNLRVAEVQGGATEQAMNEALTNQVQAQANVEDAWQSLLKDPEG